jgi:hypothetical protein
MLKLCVKYELNFKMKMSTMLGQVVGNCETRLLSIIISIVHLLVIDEFRRRVRRRRETGKELGDDASPIS